MTEKNLKNSNDCCKNCHPDFVYPGKVVLVNGSGFDATCKDCGKKITNELIIKPDSSKLESQKRWDNRILKICEQVSGWSNCLSRKVGAVLVIDKTIIATGYNGPPRGIPHCGPDRMKKDAMLNKLSRDREFRITGDNSMCPRQRLGYKSGQGLELCPAAHGEANSIVNAARIGVCVKGSVMYVNCGIPCKECLKLIINAGISEIVCTSLKTYDNLTNFLIQNTKLKIRTYN